MIPASGAARLKATGLAGLLLGFGLQLALAVVVVLVLIRRPVQSVETSEHVG